MPIALRVIAVGGAAGLLAHILLGASATTGPFAAYAEGRNLLHWASAAAIIWLAMAIALRWVKPRNKALRYVMEQPWNGFLTRLTPLCILLAAASGAILHLTCANGSCANAAAPMAGLLTGALAAVGWNYTIFENRQAEIRRSTMETINKTLNDAGHERLQTEFYLGIADQQLTAQTDLYSQWQTLHHNPLYPECVAYFTSGKEPPETLTATQKADLARLRKLYAFGKYCDFLEWLALLILMGRLDEHLSREMLKDNFVIACETLCDFILEARREDIAYYENLAWLYTHWTGKRGPLQPA